MTDSLEMDVTATVVNVESRLVSNGTKTIWEAETQDGTKWATFRADVGNAAIACKGQLADLKVSIQKNGNFTNHYLQHIKLNPDAAQTPVQQAVATAQATQEANAAPVSFSQYTGLEEAKEKRRNESIYRQVATKVAASVRSPDDTAQVFWSNVKELMEFYTTGLTPIDFITAVANQPETSVTSHTPPLATDAPPLLGDEDIPF